MLFPTIQFAIFFPIVFVLAWLLRPYPTRWKVLMVVASYFFYGWWDWHYVFLLARSRRSRTRSSRRRSRARADGATPA